MDHKFVKGLSAAKKNLLTAPTAAGALIAAGLLMTPPAIAPVLAQAAAAPNPNPSYDPNAVGAGIGGAFAAGQGQDAEWGGIVRDSLRESRARAPHPGTEESLRRYIESLEQGQPNYDEMTPGLANAVRRQLPDVLRTVKPWGALKSITFNGRSTRGGTRGMDDFKVSFEHGRAEWLIGPLTADGKVALQGFRPSS